MDPQLRLWFDHGAGDCVHFCHLLQLYKQRGYEISVHYEQNKKCIFDAAGLAYGDINGSKYHRWRYFPGFNIPAPQSDCIGSKTGSNINADPLPPIYAPRDAIWDQLCAVNLEGTLSAVIDDSVREEAASFLRGLPRPIVLLHSTGTNFQDLKSIPADTCTDLYRRFLNETNGSLVLLDWDFRVPCLNHSRIRHAKRDWGHINLYQLAALMELSDLLIGIDSGPFHLATMSKIPALGVFHHFYPSCVTLPSVSHKSAFMTRNADSYKAVNVPKRHRWDLLEYSGTYPSADDIFRHAKRMLAGSRYGCSIARDVMIQQWVRDWLASSTSSGYADRNNSFDLALVEMTRRFTDPSIVETGCIRSHEDWSAGYSTYLFGAYLDGRNCGRLTTIDNDYSHMEVCKQLTQPWRSRIGYTVGDSISKLAQIDTTIDFLYLDSLDCESPNHQEHCLAEIQTALPHLAENSLVLIDDTVRIGDQWTGKGAKVVPFLLSMGYHLLHAGYQVLLSKRCLEGREPNDFVSPRPLSSSMMNHSLGQS